MDGDPCASRSALWPVRLAGLVSDLHAGGERRDLARPEAWMLLRASLLRFLRGYSARFSAARSEDLEDLASSKALELLVRAESGEWDPGGRHAGEVAGYVAAVARNGLMRWAERRHRQPVAVAIEDGFTVHEEAGRMSTESGAEVGVETREFIEALRACVGRLQPRSRRVWFMRAFLALPSREIADHPDVRLRPSHVDVLIHRSREMLKICLESRGMKSGDLPTGAFTRLWEAMADLQNPSPLNEATHEP